MERKDVLKNAEYWVTKAQIDLYDHAEKFMEATGRNRTQLAEYLGVSKGYITQLLNGDYDHKLSKFCELALAFGYIPKINFIPVEDYIKGEEYSCSFDGIDVFNTLTDDEWKNPVCEIDNSYNDVTASFSSSSQTKKIA